jgi:hypothetical protein
MAIDASESSAWPTTVSGASGAAVTGRSASGVRSSAVQAPTPATRATAARREAEARKDRGRRRGDDTRPRYATPGGGEPTRRRPARDDIRRPSPPRASREPPGTVVG